MQLLVEKHITVGHMGKELQLRGEPSTLYAEGPRLKFKEELGKTSCQRPPRGQYWPMSIIGLTRDKGAS